MSYHSLKLYAFITRFSFPKTYRGKITLLILTTIHTPLLTLLLYTIFSYSHSTAMTLQLISIALLGTALGTWATIYVIDSILVPIPLVAKYLQKYLQAPELANKPNNFPAELGILMADTTKAIHQLDEVIQGLTNYDRLTGLANRDLLQIYLQQAISETETEFALIVLDIDCLKDINSTLGRKVGDLLLKEVSQRLTTCLESDDLLARFGGDEFAILRTTIDNHDSAIALAQIILDTLSTPFTLLQKKVHINFKIGITTYPFDGDNVEQLLQNADTAIYQAKKRGLNVYDFYSSEINRKLQRVLTIKEDLHYAIEREEFTIHYQPRIDIETNRIVATEALLRWNNPELGFISPEEFIPLAEESNAIALIGEWVLGQACLQNKKWQQQGLFPLRVSVNLSPGQFKQKDLVPTIDRILAETNLEAAYLELEITESLLVENFPLVTPILQQLKNRGITISLDDFGKGYSSLSYLQKLPIDTLKIDRSFVTNVASNTSDAAISKAIVALARSLELNIIAEGIETQEQFDYVHALGCDELQGYYFSKPLSAQDLESFFLAYQAIPKLSRHQSSIA